MTSVRTPDDRLLTVDEVATITRVPKATLLKWRQREQGPPSFRMVHRVVYYASDVQTWIAGQQEATGKGTTAGAA